MKFTVLVDPKKLEEFEVGMKLEVQVVNRETGEIVVEHEWDSFLAPIQLKSQTPVRAPVKKHE